MTAAADRMTDFQRAARATRATQLTRYYGYLAGPLRALLARQTRSLHDAEDLAQEAFLRLWRKTEWGQIQSIEAFVYKTAINLVRDRSRRTYTRMMLSSVPVSNLALQDGGSEPDRVMEAGQTLGALTQIVAQLPPDTRQAFILHKIENCSHAAIALQMGVSVSMVEKHVSRACRALRQADIGPPSG